MLFNSLHFLAFFPLVVAAYFLLPFRFRWILLLAASYYFYMCWKVEYIALIIISTLVDYFAALKMENANDKRRKKAYLILSLCSNLGILFGFKYFNFFNHSIRELFGQFNLFYNVPTLEILLPVGISFYTFQTLSYTFEVYQGKRKAERHLGIFALYVSFFPQLVAGPIERSVSLLPQFFQKHNMDKNRIVSGLQLMLWGFFKKIVIADNLAKIVDLIYSNPTGYDGSTLGLATYLFAFQIYCDFSGYSDIAIGSARVMGYELRTNFERPYASKSIHEFWQRWHISLSSWFRDYLYIPLGGNRVGKARLYFNLFIVFVVSGLWHGANWTFILWGALHGFYLIFAKITQNARSLVCRMSRIDSLPGLKPLLDILITFHLVLFAWIFFRANSLDDAYYVIGKIGTDLFSANLSLNIPESIINLKDFCFLLALISFMILYEWLKTFVKNNWFHFVILSLSFWMIFIWGSFNNQQFIYFQF